MKDKKELMSMMETKVYKLMDSFLVETDEPRSVTRLNQDRHLFVKNILELFTDTINLLEVIDEKD